MQPPILDEEQEKILLWAKNWRDHEQVPTAVIVETLVSGEVLDSRKEDEDFLEARLLYFMYNSEWRNEVLLAIQLDSYRKENDIKENDIVTNDIFAGFAKEFNWQERTFGLYGSAKNDLFIGRYPIDDFYTVE
ncbi:hypothetical protein bcgnr5372_45920 [Bacillus luti]|nr:hypothetical protein [Bacillus cereus]HDR8330090.1 hypothetical protein [Bacillus cereus]HDR8337062.1 hypothetical protein [Bacillus cereus]